MSKPQPKSGKPPQPAPANPAAGAKSWRPIVLVGVGICGVAGAVLLSNRRPPKPSPPVPHSPPAVTTTAPAAVASTPLPVAAAAPATNDLPVMEINKAVMVTVQLDFGPVVPSIAQALLHIERRHQPDDGKGRTFAILDAYGGPTPDGMKLHMSMHVSSEKPGLGQLVFTRTGEVLWKSRIVQGTNTSTFTGKNLLILIDNGAGRTFTVDGSRGPRSILEASIKELNQPMTEFWPDGAERELTFIYSSCGCPVKVMCRRVGDRTVRTKELPVIFPDDPPVETLITQLLRW
jgi:hypothetical protein